MPGLRLPLLTSLLAVPGLSAGTPTRYCPTTVRLFTPTGRASSRRPVGGQRDQSRLQPPRAGSCFSWPVWHCGVGCLLRISVTGGGQSLHLAQCCTLRVPVTGLARASGAHPGHLGVLPEAARPQDLPGSTLARSRRVLPSRGPLPAWDPNCVPASATPDGCPAIVVPGPPSAVLQVLGWRHMDGHEIAILRRHRQSYK